MELHSICPSPSPCSPQADSCRLRRCRACARSGSSDWMDNCARCAACLPWLATSPQQVARSLSYRPTTLTKRCASRTRARQRRAHYSNSSSPCATACCAKNLDDARPSLQTTIRQTWATSSARSSPCAHSKSPPQDRTISCSSAHPGQARLCSRDDFREFCLHSTTMKFSKSSRFNRSQVCSRRRIPSQTRRNAPSALHIIPSLLQALSAAAGGRDQAK